MKAASLIVSLFLCCILLFPLHSQSTFSADDYAVYLQQNKDLSFQDLQTGFPLENEYYKGFDQEVVPSAYDYFEKINAAYQVTDAEMALLKRNRFMITERLNYDCFGNAFHDIYVKDLPVFVSSDAVLHALHASYDQILIDLENAILKPNLITFLDSLYVTFPVMVDKYGDEPALRKALEDLDLYITIAGSLIRDRLLEPQYTTSEQVEQMWNAIQSEQLVSLPLFSERPRKLDFSQFTVRGHYNNEQLKDYFRAMMWLGRMDFLLTPPPENPWETPWTREEIRRMNLGAFLLNELTVLTQTQDIIGQNDHIITFMVGESDNITPSELAAVIEEQNLTRAYELLDDPTYDAYLEALKASNGAEQKILSQFMMMDPFAEEPGELPVSFRLMGQRFILDSYIFFNVVFDRIVYQGQKIWRPMPDPLDALFVLGNDDALPLLKEELEAYHYASQLASLRYLVDAYDPGFWQSSLYNVWLDAIRTLNPPDNPDQMPLFMQTAAWHQQTINTQLASWSQLRHDNLLYAKQSYTGATGCLYPHSYIEPVPELYARIAAFAEEADHYFSQFSIAMYEMDMIKDYFPRLKNTMNRLESLARKELEGQEFSEDEQAWLKEMLFLGGASGEPPFTGWYSHLYYHPEDAAFSNYIIADVHTQPTELDGTVVGKVLHVATAEIHLGIFLTEKSSSAGKPIAYVGPVMSYYEQVTRDFKRLTDEVWTETVENGDVPDRPDWVHIYLADREGMKYPAGRELPSTVYTGQRDNVEPVLQSFRLFQNYPNPFNPETTIKYTVASPEHVVLDIYNVLGEKIRTLVNERQPTGTHSVRFNADGLPSGVYFGRVQAGSYHNTIKLMVVE